jgi:hypothetical protein
MCVILVCPENVRPSKSVLYACHDANPHGAGVAWRKNGRVRWEKNLGPGKVMLLLKELPPGEAVIHFRWASVGGVDPRLCHPFPVTKRANLSLSGTADTVLFHNGTWSGYVDALLRLEEVRKAPRPKSPMSDTRAAALVTHTTGPDVLNKLPGKWVWMDARETKLYGHWQTWRGMHVSNTHFVGRLARQPSSRRGDTQTAYSRPLHQQVLFPMPDEA